MSARAFWTTTHHLVHQGEPDHLHGPGCGCPSAVHAGQHVDYLTPDGHAHHAHEGHWDECDPAAVAGLWQPSQPRQ